MGLTVDISMSKTIAIFYYVADFIERGKYGFSLTS